MTPKKSNPNAFDALFSALTESVPSVEIKGQKFLVRRLDRTDYLKLAKITESDATAKFADASDLQALPLTAYQVKDWNDMEADPQSATVLSLAGITARPENQLDHEKSLWRMEMGTAYLAAYSLTDERGHKIDDAHLGKMAALLKLHPKITLKIFDAVKQLEGDDEKNAATA